ncbi:UDP-N-acetylmuramate dehydrogenase [Labedella gwakjiensis]|uniref:UDP-N-acetylenolpyruvoylglucosamine reductase n=1 Tax=Labedella gwakjiensis TaxID=390269 RepID=A0A2P8GSN4_9MICO|nr:UDP-N-acetylmuramate dehydrogenase [Labedella gwakjiensis]PSL36980.1 UDP-N-acetylmuramate dehydrogenase [Labedella gwakjiensis]RUQ81860.1 UDP-N-acetylmuramate dehydrogenase [Labedella gwakjiensis]
MTAVTPFSSLTTFRVGGEAAEFVEATTREELFAALEDGWRRYDDWMVVGGGSNLLVGPDGFPGIAIALRTTGIDVVEADGLPDGVVRLRVQAGESWDGVVAFAVDAGLGGIEALSGIPGSAGAAPIQNIGAYGAEIGSVLASVELMDRSTGLLSHVPSSDLELGYRTSVLKRHGGAPAEREAVVVSIDLDLVRTTDGLGGPVAYAQLAGALGVSLGDRVPVRAVRDAVLALRASKGMVLDDGDPDTWSAGSFFTNPIVSERFAASLPADAPRWPVGDVEEPVTVLPLDGSKGFDLPPAPTDEQERLVKLSAAWLIENSGVHKGFTLPGSRAGISTKHTLALTNRGGATGEDVAALARYVQARVQSEFGVLLRPEPVVVDLDI